MWHPINTIPKDGREYGVISVHYNCVPQISLAYWSDDKDARDMSPSWIVADKEWSDSAMFSLFTHWTELPE